ncbi:ribosomal subunit 39S-domain-containing protein [Aspergillus transmontanensis]|uniref:Large ribosomal subunit protein mL50 n=1 Tax=Aspergillus transmontanensis TaxID=1034304 RepID=A0A5N6VMT3_9EURO|nr:ribosomal subunit 39S-domain-containing protein [Aspergillus transmontanensis]
MRPSLRLLNLEVSSLQGSRTLYVCSVCRQEARPRPLVARQFLRNASNTTPITERVRRKIWGTDNPPGLKDPYGGEGALERKFRKDQPAKQEEEPENLAQASEQTQVENEAELASAEAYEPATTWEGLQRVGHLGRWSDLPPSEADVYESFMLKKKVTKKGQLSLAAHQAAVEVSLMHSLNKPLSKVCDVVEHDKSVFKMLWKCKIQPGEWSQAVVYPSKEAEKALVYIFEQIGGQPEPAVAEETAEEVEEAVDESKWEDLVTEVNGPNVPFFGYADVRDKGFLSLSLNDPATKFAFLKRFSQLSGHYLPDPVVHSVATVGQVVEYVQSVLNPKPKKLADHLANSQGLQNLPNVKVFAKKQRPMDRDEELGRKKVIEAELRSRGLIE